MNNDRINNNGHKKLIGMQINKIKKKNLEEGGENESSKKVQNSEVNNKIEKIVSITNNHHDKKNYKTNNNLYAKNFQQNNHINVKNTQQNKNNNKDVKSEIVYKISVCVDGKVKMQPSNGEVAAFLSTKTNAEYFHKNKEWVFGAEHFAEVEKILRLNKCNFTRPPTGVMRIVMENARKIKSKDLDESPELKGGIFDKLMPFQKRGVEFALSKEGKVLLADEMGLGKTLQALAIAWYYRKEWPLLIVSPASLLHTWKDAVESFLFVYAVVVREKADLGGEVSIISYDLVSKHIVDLETQGYKVIICDECHNIKTANAKRTQSLLPLLQDAKRCVMVSGTPALSRPIELFSIFQALCKGLFRNQHEYGMRYCDGKRGYNNSYDYKGNSNTCELTYIMENKFMIRRTKEDVLKELPQKTRKQIQLKVEDESGGKATKIEKTVNTIASHYFIDTKENSGGAKKYNKYNKNEKNVSDDVMEQYRTAAHLKKDVVTKYIKGLMEMDRKFLVFAHHSVLMDAIEQCVQNMGVRYIKIDGKTTVKKRHKYVEMFQEDEYCKVGILSLTAASTGLTLTAANLVVFAELYWNPGTLMQAEDRIHRIGQKSDVEAHYIVCSGTIDSVVWPYLIKKLNVLQKLGVGENNLKNVGVGTDTGKTLRDYVE